MQTRKQQRGSLMLVAVIILVVIGFLGIVATSLSVSNTHTAVNNLQSSQAFTLAESGMQKGMRELSLNPAYLGEVGTPFANGSFTIDTTNPNDFSGAPLLPGQFHIISTGNIAGAAGLQASRTTEAIVVLGGPGGSGWAVGAGGMMLQRQGTSWVNMSDPAITADLQALYCVSATYCLAGDANGEIWWWDGSSWASRYIAPSEVFDITCVNNDPADCLVVGANGMAFNWNDTTLTASVPFSTGTDNLNGIDCPDAFNCFIAGDGPVEQFHLDGTGGWASPTVTSNNTGNQDQNDIVCTSINQCWSVGARNGGAFYIMDSDGIGMNWNDGNSFNHARRDEIFSVDCLSASLCWAVGNKGRTLYYDGVSWIYAGSLGTLTLHDISCSQALGECWVVGKRGGGGQSTIYQCTTCTSIANWVQTGAGIPGSVDLFAVYFPADVAPGGGGSAILSWREVIP